MWFCLTLSEKQKCEVRLVEFDQSMLHEGHSDSHASDSHASDSHASDSHGHESLELSLAGVGS